MPLKAILSNSHIKHMTLKQGNKKVIPTNSTNSILKFYFYRFTINMGHIKRLLMFNSALIRGNEETLEIAKICVKINIKSNDIMQILLISL